jgi:hypothetical protein
MVVRCRSELERDFSLLLEGRYGIHTSGGAADRIEPLESLTHLDAVGRADRTAIEATLSHFRKHGASLTQAVERFVRESAFTCLNRLAAIKLLEDPSRGLLPVSLGQAEQSRGYTQFALLSPEAIRGLGDNAYPFYLECLFDDLGIGLGVLFDRSLPTSILFPTSPVLHTVLEQLNAPVLAGVWAEDETIGWIYEFFTPDEQRNAARRASSVPQNSYELAFRNQFYTPRYVVCFLVDNTLGRLWWEMRQGDTVLVEHCRYLIRRTTPQPRPKRDPRTLRISRPGGGQRPYVALLLRRAAANLRRGPYDDPDLGPGLRADYPDRATFLRAVPGLILTHNLHGIDIDLRAAQIATLALWLRAQRAFQDMGIKPRQRPIIGPIHIVVAEPLPGEYDLLGEFVRDLQPRILGKMLMDIWPQLTLADEAGSLLKAEATIRKSIKDARQALLAARQPTQINYLVPAVQAPLPLDPAELADEAFWDDALDRVTAALRAFAGWAATDRNALRRLFVADALQGIAFIDLLLQVYDVVLMNPPFGAASKGAKSYIDNTYPRTKNDLYAAFVERGLELLQPGGYLGAITSRTGFFLTSFQRWREEILLKEARLIALADLGYGVLHRAMVETAAYVLEKVE